ncbi:MAG: hypothetical protein KF906_11775 [Actinobacteria bacterium]|nr:hypothetical protein [Actinomycetota bacterium]
MVEPLPTSAPRAGGETDRREEDVVWNVVWTGDVFDRLGYFVASQIAQSRSRFRFVANGCPPAEIEKMEAFRAAHPDRVVEVLPVYDDMQAHGVALDAVRACRDDGPWFGMIDPDIKALAPFVDDLFARMPVGGAITSGKEIWSRDSVLPANHPGLAGEFFFSSDGFVFGSPHLALYSRAALEDTCDRWGVGLGSGGPELRDDAKACLAEMGWNFLVFDTAKIVNLLLQADGHPLVHHDLGQLLHVGGLSHYLFPSGYLTNDDGSVEVDWAKWGDIVAARLEVARFAGRLLSALVDGVEPPMVPVVDDDHLREVLPTVRDEIADLVERYRADMAAGVPPRS